MSSVFLFFAMRATIMIRIKSPVMTARIQLQAVASLSLSLPPVPAVVAALEPSPLLVAEISPELPLPPVPLLTLPVPFPAPLLISLPTFPLPSMLPFPLEFPFGGAAMSLLRVSAKTAIPLENWANIKSAIKKTDRTENKKSLFDFFIPEIFALQRQCSSPFQ